MAVGKKKMYNQPCSPAAMIFPSWYSVIEKLIHFFAGSPYTNAENYEETLHRLIDIFYSFKSDTWETVSDDQLIGFMKEAFDGSCRGSLEILETREMVLLSSHIHSGRNFESFSIHKEILK